jgi:hypothetical protein
LQATLDFTTDRLREVEEQLEKFRAEVDELNASIKASFRGKRSVFFFLMWFSSVKQVAELAF